MFETKNLSPQKLSLVTAFILSVPISLFILFIKPGWMVLIAFVIIFFGSYLLIQLTLEKFIYRKIKLIYKLIYQTKATQREEMYNKYILPKKSIDDVTGDVEKWATQRTREIDILKSNEVYRKEFLQNLSHEFKTPVFAIQGYVDTLLDGALENNEVNKKFLQNASKNVDRLVALVNDLDEITRLESGEQPLNETNFIIQDLIKEIIEALSLGMSRKNIKALIKKGCEAPIIVTADKEKIKQVIINLVSNAIKYGKQDGNVTASIYQTDDKRILVEISDDGIGIGKEHLPRIFERFYRTDQGRSRNVGGAGLGLAICKHIIEAHGENIHVRSKIDVGTTVGFTLKKASKAATQIKVL